MQFISKASNIIDFLGQYKFPVLIFLGKNIQVAGGERPEALLLITIYQQRVVGVQGQTMLWPATPLLKIQQANSHCLCPKLCQKKPLHRDFWRLTNISQWVFVNFMILSCLLDFIWPDFLCSSKEIFFSFSYNIFFYCCEVCRCNFSSIQ